MHDEPAARASDAQLDREVQAALEVAATDIAPALAYIVDDPIMRAHVAGEIRDADELQERAAAARDPDHPDHCNWGLQLRARSAREAQLAARQRLGPQAPTPIVRIVGRPRRTCGGTRRPGARRTAQANAPPGDDGSDEPEPGDPSRAPTGPKGQTHELGWLS